MHRHSKALLRQNTDYFFPWRPTTSRGSVILTAIEKLPISPESPSGFATDCAYEYFSEPQKAGAGVGQRIYIGQVYDGQTQLSYLSARYYNGSQGHFISQDPVFLGNPTSQSLSDPQSLNAYSYSEDNPIIKSDPNGRQDAGEVILGMVALDLFVEGGEDYTPSVAEQAALFDESTQADPLLDIGKNPKLIEMVGTAPTYGLDTAPILNGPDGFMAPNVSSPFLRISAPIVSTVAIGTIAYRSFQGVTDQEDPNPPTTPHISSQPSTNSSSNGRSVSTNSQNSANGGISQSNLASLNSILNQLTALLSQLQSVVASRSTNNGSSRN